MKLPAASGRDIMMDAVLFRPRGGEYNPQDPEREVEGLLRLINAC